MGRDNRNNQFVCYACIGDVYLKEEICSNGSSHICMICGKRQPTIAFGDLCNSVHDIITSEFIPTDREPGSWTPYKEAGIDWIRKGKSMYDILDEMLECGDLLINAVKKELSSRYSSIEEIVSGEENPYGDEIHYELRDPDDYRFRSVWSDFETEICTRARFFNGKAESILNEIFCDLDRFKSYAKPLIRKVGPNTETEVLYRARRAPNRAEITRILEYPAYELGAPPSRLAASGRMNPQWISMFYGAFDPETCIAEVRPPAGSFVVVGKFTIVRNLQLLDIGALQNFFIKKDSFFDPEFRYLLNKARFFKRLVDIMSRPILPSDENYHYLPTQAVAEYLSEKIDPQIDGLVFPSSQLSGKGENVVLFHGAFSVEPDGSDKTMRMAVIFERPWYNEEDEEDFSILLTRKRIRNDEELSNSRENRISWTDLEQYSEEKPTLRIDLNSLEIKYIQTVGYKTETRHVWCDLDGTD